MTILEGSDLRHRVNLSTERFVSFRAEIREFGLAFDD